MPRYDRLHGMAMTRDLFSAGESGGGYETIAEGAMLLRGFALAAADELLDGVADVARSAPFRQMVTPGGHTMSVAMTNCGAFGWITDRAGYRYTPIDPMTGRPWPAMPARFRSLANEAAAAAGYLEFSPNACLINRYEPGSRLTAHQDRNERDLTQPIVSVSIGLPAVFLFGGARRTSTMARHALRHGDVVAWGGPSRLFFHGVAPLKAGEHSRLGPARVNLTFRYA